MIRVRGLISSIKSSYLLNRNAFPHKVEESWEKEFSQENAKMSYLEKLLQTNEIRPYFIQKDIKELEKQDIYFYMYNKELFHRIPRHSKQELIKNPNASTILKFHLALELNSLHDQEVKSHLLESFNSSINTLSTNDLLFCLQIVSSFKEAKQEISNLQLEKKFLEEDGTLFIKFVYLLSELEMKLQTISPDVIVERMAQIDNLELQTIYEIKNIAQFYQLNLPEPIQKRLTQSFSQKRRIFNKQDSSMIVSLLPFYPQSANLLNITSLSVDSYLHFLQFFSHQNEGQQKLVPKPIQHAIPASILAQANIFQLQKIIKKRVHLQLQSVQTLLHSVKDHFTSNLNGVIAIIRYLEKQDKINAQAESILQKSIYKKIIKQGHKVFQHFKIVDVFKILGYLSVKQLGTIDFWKKTLKFVTDVIEQPQKYKNLTSEQQKKFIVYVFQIFRNKPFPREIEQQIINLTLLSLTINQWKIKEIFPLVISLKVNKIGDNELWFGIQQRLKKMDLRNLDSHDERRLLKNIVYNFNMISKGSYEFWTEINKALGKKEKQQILNGFKIPSTLAHTYFKI